MSRKWLVIGVSIIVFVALLAWLYIESTKSLPGLTSAYNCDQAIDFSKVDNTTGDKCRVHVPEGTEVKYPTNPPSFGPHYPSWIIKGFYSEPRADGNLMHSLEHGYIIFWYDCEKQLSTNNYQLTISQVYAQASSSAPIGSGSAGLGMTGGSEGSPSAKLEDLPEAFRNGSCDDLKSKIKEVMAKNGQHKLIAVPKVGLDSALILTAWNRMEKLTSVDEKKIKQFIDAFRDNGPEPTNEP